MVASVDGLACPLPLPRAHSRLDTGGGGEDALPGFVLSHRVRMVGGVLLVHYPRAWRLVEIRINSQPSMVIN
jgi:hypothetical protein